MKRILALILTVVLVLGTVPFVALPTSAKIIGEVEGGSWGKIFWSGKVPKLDNNMVSCGFKINSESDADTSLYYVNKNKVPPQNTLTTTGITYDQLKGASALYSSDTTINIVLEQDWTTSHFITADCNINIDLNGHTWTVTGEEVMDTCDKNVRISGGTMIFENTEWGPIRATDESNLTICDVIFRDCHCDESGVVYFTSFNGKLYMENVTFENCYCDGWGACVYIENPRNFTEPEWRPQVIIKNCNFTGCHSYNGGGVFYSGMDQCDITFENCFFLFDRSDKYCGGVIYANGDYNTYKFRNCAVYGCYAYDAGGFAFVGGVHNDFIGDPDFNSNDKYNMDTRSTVCGCYAIGSGGAIYVSNSVGYGHYCKINGFNFVQNTAGSATHTIKSIESVDANEWGGALCLRGQFAEVQRCDFIENYAHYYGGAIYLGDNDSSVKYCVFRDNWSDPNYKGEDIFNDDSGNTISDNIYYSDREDTIYMYYSGTNINNTHYSKKAGGKLAGLSGSGTASDPWLVTCSRAMLDLAMNVSSGVTYEGKYFRVTKNINNIYVPIGIYSAQPFKGNFDGDGHTFRAYMRFDKDDVGIFGYAVSGTIQNIHLKDGFISGLSDVGGICGTANGVTFKNCTNSATVNSKSDGMYIGGIGGCVSGTTRFEKCTNNGKVYGANEAIGGITGGSISYTEKRTSQDATVFNTCRNNGYVWASGSTGSTAGGIVGNIFGEMTFKNCINTGTVEARNINAGGIAGAALSVVSGSKASFIIMNCMNSGRIIAGTSNAGGIIGYSTIQGGVRQILNCANYGSIKAPKEQGGILTTVYSMPNKDEEASCGETYKVDVINCYNDGDMPFNHNSGAIVAGAGLANCVNCICNGNRTVPDGHATVLSGDDHYLRAVQKLNVYLCEHKSETKDWVYWWLSPDAGRAELDFLSVEIGKYAGSGTENNPYVIEKTSDLRYLELELAQGKSRNVDGKYFLLKKDIAYAGNPIGDSTVPFGGIFDGGGHTITVTVKGAGNTGLFGVVKNATIKNLNVTGLVDGDWLYVGGVAGWSENSTFTNCSSSTTVTGAHYVGGIVGGCRDTAFIDCTNNGTVACTGANAGGIAAGCWGNVTAIRCCNNAPVTSASIAAGGILCAVFDGCSVVSCVNTQKGTILAGWCAAGIVGNLINNTAFTPRIENCANLGKITVGNSVGGIVSNGNPKTVIHTCFSGGKLTATEDFGYGAIVQGTQVVTFNCYYMTDIGVSDDSSTALEKQKCGAGLVQTINRYIEGTPDLKTEWTLWGLDMASHLASPLGTEKDVSTLTGLGSEDKPYLIKSAADFIEISARLSEDSTATHYRLIANIDDYAGTPIGTPDEPFVGIFDGNGYTVHITSMNGAENVGLFGYVDGGTITNLYVTGKVTGNLGMTGAVVGTAKNAQIINCASIATVEGTSQVGGIVGNASGTTLISNCYVSSNVKGSGENVGGIAGKISDSTVIRNSIKIETVTGSKSVGGIVGTMDGAGCAVENCGHYGNITGTDKTDNYALGGIVGKAVNGGRIFLCFFAGRIDVDLKNGARFADGSCGIMIGEKATATTCDYLYYFKDVIEEDEMYDNWHIVGNDEGVKADPRKESYCKKKMRDTINGIVPSYKDFTVWYLNDDVDSMASPGNYVQVEHKGVTGAASVFAENAPLVVTVCAAVTAAGTALALVVGIKRRRKKQGKDIA